MTFIKTRGGIEMEMRERPITEEEREKMRLAYEQIRPFLRSSSSSSSQQEEDPCPLGSSHIDMKVWAAQYLSSHRSDIGIEDPWSLLAEVICPASFSSSPVGERREHEASIEWDSEVWFAHVSLCCNLPFELRQWVLIHELFELKHWRTGDAFHSLVSLLPPSELRDLVVHQFYQARNQEIEQEVGQYLGRRRPHHMTSHPLNDEKKHEELVEHLRAWREEEPNILTLTEEEMENIRL